MPGYQIIGAKYGMPGLTLEFDLLSGKVSVRAWFMAADLARFCLSIARVFLERICGKQRYSLATVAWQIGLRAASSSNG